MEAGLNQRLYGLHHGAQSAAVELATWEGSKLHPLRAYVYWPFVTFRQSSAHARCSRDWNITHAPTGRFVSAAKTKTAAVAEIRRLLKLGDWEFIDPKCRKARRMQRLLPPLVRIN